MLSKKKDIFSVGDFLRSNSHGGNFVKVKAGQNFYNQGDQANSVYWLQRGSAKMTVVSDQGREAVVGVLAANDFFGQRCIPGHGLRITSIVALEDCDAFRLSDKKFATLLHENSIFAEYFTSYLLLRSIRLESDLIDQLFNSSEKRLARLLLILSNFDHNNESKSIFTTIDQNTLAQMIGTTRARVNSFMNKFRESGFIEYNGDLVVNDFLIKVLLYDDPYNKDNTIIKKTSI